MHYCNHKKLALANINTTIDNENQTIEYKSSVQIPDVYTPVVLSCESLASNYTLEFFFKNGDSLLDSRWENCFTVIPFVIISSVILYLCWLINFILYRKAFNWLYFSITCIQGMFVIHLASSFLVILHDRTNQPNLLFTNISEWITRVYRILLFSVICLVSQGWCVINNSISIKTILSVIGGCIFLIYTMSLAVSIESEILSISFFCISTIVLIAFWAFLISGIREVDRQILGHMLIISRDGVDPTSTPIYNRHVTYTFFTHLVIIFLSGLIISFSLEIAGCFRFWVKMFYDSILHLIFLTGLGVLFHPRKVECNDYTRIEDSAELDILELESLDPTFNEEKSHGLVKWEEGMLLPPKPQIVRHQNSNLIISSNALDE